MVLVAHRKSTAYVGAAFESYCRERERRLGLNTVKSGAWVCSWRGSLYYRVMRVGGPLFYNGLLGLYSTMD
jgi:hypothetical protein